MLARLGITQVPWEVARGFSPAQVLAARIIAGEVDGHRFDWDNFRWLEPGT